MENKDKKVTSTKPTAEKEQAVVKTADKVVPAAKEVKPVAKMEAVKKAETPKPEVEKKAEAPKPEAEKKEAKPEEKEVSAKKTRGRKAGKVSAKKKTAEKVEEVYIQYLDLEVTTKEIVDKVKQIYVNQGHRESSIKSLRVYIKPEENKAYYVINEKITDGIDL